MLELNEYYTNKEVLDSIRFRLKKEHSIKLQEIFSQRFYKILKMQCDTIKWIRSVEPQNHSYATAVKIPLAITKMLTSSWWKTWLQSWTECKTQIMNPKLLLFSKGDYTLQHEKQISGLHMLIDIGDVWDDESGGFTLVVKQGKECVRISPTPNSLAVFNKKKGMNSFVKYVNHDACSKHRIVLYTVYKR